MMSFLTLYKVIGIEYVILKTIDIYRIPLRICRSAGLYDVELLGYIIKRFSQELYMYYNRNNR